MTLQTPVKPFDKTGISVFDDPNLFYPDGDGEPLAETLSHQQCMFYGVSALTAFYARDPNVWVAGNNFIYYEMNQPIQRVSPDLYVVKGVAKDTRRDSYYTWRENDVAPAIVFEFTSKSTRTEDTNRKKTLYEQVLRVPEYILFDPTGDYLNPTLQGFRLVNGVYVPIVPLAPGRLFSHELGLEIVAQGNGFRFFDPVRGVVLAEYQEVLLRAESETERANAETERANAEAERAEQETARRAEAEAENDRLRALIAQMSQQAQTNDSEGEA